MEIKFKDLSWLENLSWLGNFILLQISKNVQLRLENTLIQNTKKESKETQNSEIKKNKAQRIVNKDEDSNQIYIRASSDTK